MSIGGYQLPRAMLAIKVCSWRTALPWLVAASFAGCARDGVKIRVERAPDSSTVSTRSESRRFVPFRIDTITWSLRDTLLRSSEKVVIAKSLFIFQIGFARLRAIDLSGARKWDHDVSSDGLRRISDVRAGGGDTVFVLDAETDHLLTLNAEGNTTSNRQISHVGHADVFVPLRGDSAVAITADSLAPFVVFDRNGHILARRELSWPGFSKLNFLARQSVIGSSGGDSTWVLGFAFGNGFLVFDGTRAKPFRGSFVEPVPFPDVIVSSEGADRSERLGRVTAAAAAIAVHGTEVLVLFGGTDTTLKFRVLDRYSATDGKYRGSYLLPSRANSLAVHGEQVLVQFPKFLGELVELGTQR